VVAIVSAAVTFGAGGVTTAAVAGVVSGWCRTAAATGGGIELHNRWRGWRGGTSSFGRACMPRPARSPQLDLGEFALVVRQRLGELPDQGAKLAYLGVSGSVVARVRSIVPSTSRSSAQVALDLCDLARSCPDVSPDGISWRRASCARPPGARCRW